MEAAGGNPLGLRGEEQVRPPPGGGDTAGCAGRRHAPRVLGAARSDAAPSDSQRPDATPKRTGPDDRRRAARATAPPAPEIEVAEADAVRGRAAVLEPSEPDDRPRRSTRLDRLGGRTTAHSRPEGAAA